MSYSVDPGKNFSYRQPETNEMTETEKLLINAQDIARRAFVDPSEAAVLAIFEELRIERDRMAWAIDGRESAAVH
ncbi:hypothetical protein EGU54_32240 [Achromobacter aegrifaciens]|nr:hypothetical protein EGU54_32240 [Achromobacter aegrifaciens]